MMDRHSSTLPPQSAPHPSLQHPPMYSSFPPPHDTGWNSQCQGHQGRAMQIQSHWNNLNYPPPPPSSHNNFSQPPPPNFHSNQPPPPPIVNRGSYPLPDTSRLPPPVINANTNNRGSYPLNTNRPPPPVIQAKSNDSTLYQSMDASRPPPPQPVNFYSPTSSIDVHISGPPPPFPNPPPSFYPPPHQHGYSPNNIQGGPNVTQHQLSSNPPHPLSMPPQQNNSSRIGHGQNHQYDYHGQLQSDMHSIQHEKLDISKLPGKLEKHESESEKQKNIGQQRIESWLRKIGKVKKKVCTAKSSEKPSNVKLNEYLCRLQAYANSISDLSKQVERLDSMTQDADRTSWQQESNTVETLKARQREFQSVMDNTVVEQVDKKLCRTRQKKARLMRRRSIEFQQRQEVEELREAKEKEISNWQQRLLLEMKEDLLKKERKREMDQTLSAVTKKIQDANRLVDTMTALEKLRLIRQDAAKKRGDSDIGESRQSFEQKIQDMTRLVRSQLEVYKEEEETLRGVIRSEHEETSKKEKELQETRSREEQRQRDEDLGKMLFGFSDDASMSDPLYSFQQYYRQAESNLPAFVHIRHEWDQYLVPPSDPNGSSIPMSWVQPSDPTSRHWAIALI